jgi:hypothetical protein
MQTCVLNEYSASFMLPPFLCSPLLSSALLCSSLRDVRAPSQRTETAGRIEEVLTVSKVGDRRE